MTEIEICIQIVGEILNHHAILTFIKTVKLKKAFSIYNAPNFSFYRRENWEEKGNSIL